MTTVLFPLAFALVLWWFSTGVILYLDGLPPRTYRWSLAGATVVLAGAIDVLYVTSQDATAGAMYATFAAAILVWGWIEMAFLMGFVTGPRKSACPPGSRGWRRASYALETILYHEFALLAGGLVIALVTRDAPNRLGIETFAVLWIARQSTKLNLFFGVRNLSAEMLPPNLRYLQTYFKLAPVNLLFPFSVTAGTIGAVVCWQMSATADSVGEATAMSSLATLLSLALLEHWFLVVPFDANALWEWGLRSRRLAPMVADITGTAEHAQAPPR